MNMKQATAIYTGGNIYNYYAELEDGRWLMGSEEWMIIVNENPLDKKWVMNEVIESDTYDWQMEHLVDYIPDDKFHEVLDAIIDEIIQGNTIKEFDNFTVTELKQRHSKHSS